MYSDKENINILTAVLAAQGLRHAVVCPGSRNAPIVHNLHEHPQIVCHPVTDERSAGFCALGLAQATGQAVAVCVTSGSAVLGLAPAVAEAAYQHLPLIVITADRPRQWIGQLDGQTLPQPGAFGTFVRRAVDLPEPRTDEERWLCNRLVNEALVAATLRQGAPVHINVPISEPLFRFTTAALPEERTFSVVASGQGSYAMLPPLPEVLVRRWAAAERPMIVVGQTAQGLISTPTWALLAEACVVWAEALAAGIRQPQHIDEAVRLLASDVFSDAEREAYRPDYIIYLGDTLVSKAARRWLRASGAPSCVVTPDASVVADPLMSLQTVVECPAGGVDHWLATLARAAAACRQARPFADRWHRLLALCAAHAHSFCPQWSQMAAVSCLEQHIATLPYPVHTHYANSTAIRLANIYAAHHVWCNRGVNGIEGSLSAAAGFSLATSERVVCVIGDLSFFYDQNALWNTALRGNLRIMLLNNGGGGIFRQLPGLEDSSAALALVGAAHHTTARGICLQNACTYLEVHTAGELPAAVVDLLERQAARPVVLEVFTDGALDAQTMTDYYNSITEYAKQQRMEKD